VLSVRSEEAVKSHARIMAYLNAVALGMAVAIGIACAALAWCIHNQQDMSKINRRMDDIDRRQAKP
jgi:hypothetical protein